MIDTTIIKDMDISNRLSCRYSRIRDLYILWDLETKRFMLRFKYDSICQNKDYKNSMEVFLEVDDITKFEHDGYFLYEGSLKYVNFDTASKLDGEDLNPAESYGYIYNEEKSYIEKVSHHGGIITDLRYVDDIISSDCRLYEMVYDIECEFADESPELLRSVARTVEVTSEDGKSADVLIKLKRPIETKSELELKANLNKKYEEVMTESVKFAESLRESRKSILDNIKEEYKTYSYYLKSLGN